MADLMQIINGVLTRVVPNSTSAGAGDAGKAVQLDAGGKLDSSLLPASALQGAEDYDLVAFEAISAGDLVNIFSDAGVAKIRKADATDTTKPSMGFCPAAIASAATGTVRLGNGVVTGLTGLTIGALYYLSAATPGGITLTAPSATGNIVYAVGRAKSATEFNYVDDTTPVLLA